MTTIYTTTAHTEKELEAALERRDSRIVYEGSNALEIISKLEAADARKKKARNTGIFMSILCLAAAPFTCGGSVLALGATAGAIAISDTVIVAIIGAIVTLSVEAMRNLKEYKIKKLAYNRVEFTRM